MTLSEDSRRIHLRFVGAKEFSADDPCSARYAASTEILGDVLRIGLIELDHPLRTAETSCDAMGYGRSLDVDLEHPFTGTIWDDLYGYRHFLEPPAGLVELTGLPSGWLLRAQGDVGESPTGRWERTYSPDTSLADRTKTVVLYQSFDGPADVTGGSGDSAPVEVNGEAASLYTWPPAGELVLVWQLDGDGLALVAYEPQFSVAALIALAESATAGLLIRIANHESHDTVVLLGSGIGRRAAIANPLETLVVRPGGQDAIRIAPPEAWTLLVNGEPVYHSTDLEAAAGSLTFQVVVGLPRGNVEVRPAPQ